ncbi:MAG: hypothetical protein ACD_46C00187G0004 [uncultured bacterium]|nr:MAG: hypothetical protein ACD_46C00187G0004 [uncultured bacterium]
MKKIHGCFLLVSLILASCSPVNSLEVFDRKQINAMINEHHEIKPAKQRIRLDLPNANEWQRIDMSVDKKGSPIVLIPTSQTVNNAKEKISTWISAYLSQPDLTTESFLQNDVKELKNRCDIVNVAILSSNKNDLLYRIETHRCNDAKNKIQIGKVFNGIDAIYVVHYTALMNEVSATRINAMQKVIAAAQLVISHHSAP